MNSKKNGIDKDKTIKKLRSIAVLLVLLLVGVVFIVGSYFIQQKSPFWSIMLRDIGFVFCPVAALALLYNYFAEKTLMNHIAETIWEKIKEKSECKYCQQELLNIYPNRNDINFDDFFGRAKEKIWILTTNLLYFHRYLALLESKAKEGTEVSILTLNPDNSFLNSRYKELEFAKCIHFFDELIASLRDFCNKKEKEFKDMKNHKFTIKIYDNSPSIMMFRSDDRIIIGHILRHGRARAHIHIEFNSSTKFSINEKHCKDFIDHFEIMWKEAKELSLEEIDNLKSKCNND